ncbi:ABC transporter ATP-binding protein [Neisseria gonorrhoeae]|uniref:ABC transporter ATP-binding protein n=1 Tax=Neisseria gonorrhoeae TaxID=485 RepID=A0A378VTH9_NEIGO|nr:ABC transporter ATP-binding protein [Neisseria gonorrhoeae]
MEIIRRLHEAGHTVIMVTHDPGIAANANRVIEIRDGEIISDTSKNPEIPASNVGRIQEKPRGRFITTSLSKPSECRYKQYWRTKCVRF